MCMSVRVSVCLSVCMSVLVMCLYSQLAGGEYQHEVRACFQFCQGGGEEQRVNRWATHHPSVLLFLLFLMYE